MNHWFDRLAVHAADSGTEQRLSRRDVVRSAAAGAAVVGGLASPLVPAALGKLPPCECQERAKQKYVKDMKGATRGFYNTSFFSGVLPVTFAIFFTEAAGIELEFLGTFTSCGKCDQDPKLGKAPPKDDQPCLARGGYARRDQCGGTPEPPETGCAQGTKDCGGGLCCFGDDLCCGGCCCIAPVGCGCCG
jgi:hypothetical protein